MRWRPNEKTERAYKRLVEAIGKARRGGLIDFDAIRDDGVMRIDPSGYDGIDDLIAVIRWRVDEYQLNRQIGQPSDLADETFGLACEACERRGRYSVAGLIDKRGDARLTDLLGRSPPA